MWFSYYIMRESIWILHHHLPSSLQMCFLPHAHKLFVLPIFTPQVCCSMWLKSVETSSCCPLWPETHSSDTCFPLQLFEFETPGLPRRLSAWLSRPLTRNVKALLEYELVWIQSLGNLGPNCVISACFQIGLTLPEGYKGCWEVCTYSGGQWLADFGIDDCKLSPLHFPGVLHYWNSYICMSALKWMEAGARWWSACVVYGLLDSGLGRSSMTIRTKVINSVEL